MVFLGFKRIEFIWIIGTLAIIVLATVFNLSISLRRSRDAQRKDDIRSVSTAIEAFKKDYAYFPLSQDGQILACGTPELINDHYVFSPCQWGQDTLYSVKLPIDRHHNQGVRYKYISDGTSYSLYASLEDPKDDEYNPQVAQMNQECGTSICNFKIPN